MEARRALGLPLNCLIVRMAGRLSRQKGQKFYLEAAQQIIQKQPNVIFAHAGKIPRKDSDDQYERELTVDSEAMCSSGHFQWLDYVNRIALFWAAVDIAVLPSCGPDAMPRVIIEAMAMQRPVISTPVGGPQEIIETPDLGLLVPMADSVALANAISKLLNDPGERQQLGVLSRKRVERFFSANIYAHRMMNLYDHVLMI